MNLKENESYKIETIQDLFNCPNNMMEECIQGIVDVFKKKLELEVEKGRSLKIEMPYFILTNDGKNETIINYEDLAE